MKPYIITFLLLLPAFTLNSIASTQEDIKDIKGTYVYTVHEDQNITFAEARHNAIQNARIQALKETFGTSITTETELLTDLNNQVSNETMTELTAEALNGEWLDDNTQPNVDILYDKQQHIFSYIVTLNGTARQRQYAATDFQYSVLIGGKTADCQTNTAINKQRMYLSFQAPKDGYIAIYMGESQGPFSCLLPYRNSGLGSYPITAGQDYLFFDQTIDPQATPIALTTRKGVEIDAIYIVFSTKPFSKCRDTKVDARHPNQISAEYFKHWLLENRNHDKDLEELHKWIKIVQQ